MTSGKTPTWHLFVIQPIWVLFGHLLVLPVWLLIRTDAGSAQSIAHADAQVVATIVTAFCFTMMGFIVASLSILTLFADSSAVQQYRRGKYALTLVFHIGLTLIELAVVFLWALLSVLVAPSSAQITWMMLATAGCLGMTLFCCLPMLVLQFRAIRAAS